MKNEISPAILHRITSGLEKQVSPLAEQVGGSHYKQYKIQPIEFAMANQLNYCQANIIKYTCRYKDKAGFQDLLKARHNLDILMEMEYPNDWAKFTRREDHQTP